AGTADSLLRRVLRRLRNTDGIPSAPKMIRNVLVAYAVTATAEVAVGAGPPARATIVHIRVEVGAGLGLTLSATGLGRFTRSGENAPHQGGGEGPRGPPTDAFEKGAASRCGCHPSLDEGIESWALHRDRSPS